MAQDYDENETVYRGRRDGLWSADYGDRSLRKVLTSSHHIASTDNFQIHATERLRYNTRGTRKRTSYTQYPLQNMLRHPGEGTHYMTVTVICGNFDPLLGFWKIGIVWPLYVRKNMEISYFGEMFSFYSPFRPFVAFWINGWGCSPGSASPSETHPHPGQTRQQTNWDFKICLPWR